MNDKELLEAAAKAIDIYLWGEDCFWVHGNNGALIVANSHPEFSMPKDIISIRATAVCGNGGLGWYWSPLMDDGDRFRLIAKLGMGIDFAECTVWKRFPDGRLIQEFWGGECGDEAYAVLRVAAAIANQGDGNGY